MKEEYKIGDYVKVLSAGLVFTTYSYMFNKLNFKCKGQNAYHYSKEEKNKWIVFGIADYEDGRYNKLLAIRNIYNESKEILIESIGVEIIIHELNYEIY